MKKDGKALSNAVRAYHAKKARLDILKEELEVLERQIVDILKSDEKYHDAKDAGLWIYRSTEFTCRYKEFQRANFSRIAFDADYPGVYEKYKTQISASHRFEIK